MEAPPLFPEASAEDDDDSESTLAKKRDKRFEAKDADDKKPKRISLENLFVREEIKDDDETKKTDITEVFTADSRDTQESPVEQTPEEAAEALEADDNLETLDENESRYAVEAIAHERTEQLQGELAEAEPGSQKEAEALAGAAFVENLLDHAARGEQVDEDLIDAALAEAADDIGVAGEAEGSLNTETSEETSDTEPGAEDDTALPAAPLAGAGGSSGMPPAGGSGTGSGTPPPSPPPTGGSASPPPPPPGSYGPLAGLPGPVAPAAAVGAPVMPTEAIPAHEHGDSHSHVKYVLGGGIVGYLIGRRRGRIRAEKRLLPVQEKLESQVSELAGQIAERELRIRQLARQQFEKQAFDSRAVVEKLNAKNERRQEHPREPLPFTPEHVVSTASSEYIRRNTIPEAQPLRTERAAGDQGVESMLLADLLQVARTIEIGGQSVRSLFEAGRIDTPALRRIVKEFMHNGDYKKELLMSMKPEQLASQESMEHEARFEQSGLQQEVQKSAQAQSPQNGQPYAELYAQNDAPPIGFTGNGVNQGTPQKGGDDMKRKLLIGIGSVVVVIILAFIVGSLLLMVI